MFMIDYLRNNPEKIRDKSEFQYYSKSGIVKSLDEAVSINNQNVLNYITTKEKWTLKDLRYPKPQFPCIFLEAEEPPPHRLDIKKFGIPSHGMLVVTGDGKQKINYAYAIHFIGIKDFKNKFVQMGQGATMFWAYDKEGNIIKRYESNSLMDKLKRKLGLKDSSYEEISYFDGDYFYNALTKEKQKYVHENELSIQNISGVQLIGTLMTFSFMNCKNVSMPTLREGSKQTYTPTAVGERKPITKIYTLTIDPIKKIIQSKCNGQSNLTPKSLHICRGHFKDFSHGKGLFGQHKGIYWWPMQTRGNEKYGKIIKDYKVLSK